MKKIFAAALSIVILSSCNDNKKQETDALNQILKVHDNLMAQDDKLTSDKSKLDSMVKYPPVTPQTVADTEEAKKMIKQLSVAEDAMDKWMHQFEPDQSSKPHDAKMKYFEDQKKQIMTVDTQINNAIKAAEQFIKAHPKTA